VLHDLKDTVYKVEMLWRTLIKFSYCVCYNVF